MRRCIRRGKWGGVDSIVQYQLDCFRVLYRLDPGSLFRLVGSPSDYGGREGGREGDINKQPSSNTTGFFREIRTITEKKKCLGRGTNQKTTTQRSKAFKYGNVFLRFRPKNFVIAHIGPPLVAHGIYHSVPKYKKPFIR